MDKILLIHNADKPYNVVYHRRPKFYKITDFNTAYHGVFENCRAELQVDAINSVDFKEHDCNIAFSIEIRTTHGVQPVTRFIAVNHDFPGSGDQCGAIVSPASECVSDGFTRSLLGF